MNGVLKDEATYYEDSEKYSGNSGSNTNKYVIEDSYDFISVMSSGNSETHARLVNDIDMNEHSTYKRGFIDKSLFNNRSVRLYGDGHKIKNIVVISCSTVVFLFYYIENCNFINLVSVSSTFPIEVSWSSNSSTYSKTVRGCNFGIYLNNSEFNPRGWFQDCTFNIKGQLRDGCSVVDLSNLGYFQQSHINVDVQINTVTLFKHTSDNSGYSDRFVNSYITGKIINKYNGAVKWCTWATNGYQYFEPTNSYFAFEYEQVTPQEFEITTFHSCFVDGELFSKNGCTVTFDACSSSYSGAVLTTAQAQDADYLNSIGFACVSVE